MSDNECLEGYTYKKTPTIWSNATFRNAVVVPLSVILAGWLWSMAAYVALFYWIPFLTLSLYCAYIAIGYFVLKLPDRKILLSAITPRFVALAVAATFVIIFGASRVDAFQQMFFIVRLFTYPAHPDLAYTVSNHLSLVEGGYGYMVLQLIDSCIAILAPVLFVLLGATLQRWKLTQKKCAADQQSVIVKAISILENNFIALSLHIVLNAAFIVCASFLYWNTLASMLSLITFALLYIFLASKLLRASSKHSALSIIAPAAFIALGFAVGTLTAYANNWSIESLDALTTTSMFYFFTFDISFSMWQGSSLFWKVLILIGAVVTPSTLMLLGLVLKRVGSIRKWKALSRKSGWMR